MSITLSIDCPQVDFDAWLPSTIAAIQRNGLNPFAVMVYCAVEDWINAWDVAGMRYGVSYCDGRAWLNFHSEPRPLTLKPLHLPLPTWVTDAPLSRYMHERGIEATP